MTEAKLPLWRSMYEAGWVRGLTAESHQVLGSEIMAIAECLERWQLECYGVVLPDVREVVDWLQEEAVRAERGE